VKRSDGPRAFLAALAATVVGVIWLVGGLAFFNIFFSYPIILIVVGIIGMITNAAGLVRRPQPPQARIPYGVPPSQPLYYTPQPMLPVASPSAPCWQCGRPNEGRSICATCGAAQYSQPPQQPMGPYGTAPAYPPVQGYPPSPNYPPAPNYPPGAGYPPAPVQPPADGWGQPPQPPQQGQGW
jgi:hypothetical protein